MKSISLLLAATCSTALGQGSLTPPGSPAPTMKSLQQIWDKSTALESQSQVQQQLISILLQKSNEQNSVLGVLLEKSGVTLPWKLTTIDSTGNVPCNSSLAFTPVGQPAICYYDSINQDLKYMAFDGTAWHVTPVASTGDVGSYNSLAFTPAGLPAIAYYDKTNGDLRYASFNGVTWQTTPVDTVGDVGAYLSLKMSPTGQPAISYFDITNQDVKFASFNGTVWTPVTVDSAVSGTGGTSLAFSATGNPTIGYSAGLTTGIRLAELLSSSWVISTAYSPALSEEVTGTSLAISPTGATYLAFETYDRGAEIRLVKRSVYGSWSTIGVPSQVISASDWGFAPSLAFTPDGQPAISITQDPHNIALGFPNLRYLSFDGSNWKVADVDAAPLVGFASSLAFTPAGQPAVSYYDKTNGKITYAVRAPFIAP